MTTDAEAKDLATDTLASGLLESVDVTFDSLPIPHLEEGDAVRVATDKFNGNFRLSQFALPLNAAGDMSIGYVRNVKPRKAMIRQRRS